MCIACIAQDISGCEPIGEPSTYSWTSDIAKRYPAIVLKAKPLANISTKNLHISLIGQTMGSIDLSLHQETHWLRFEDTVREEFESIADSKSWIAFGEKPLASYHDRRLCTRRLTTSGCGGGVDGDVLERESWETAEQ